MLVICCIVIRQGIGRTPHGVCLSTPSLHEMKILKINNQEQVNNKSNIMQREKREGTCPYANTELLNPARQFSTRGTPTSSKISTWKTGQETALNNTTQEPSNWHERDTENELSSNKSCLSSVGLSN